KPGTTLDSLSGNSSLETKRSSRSQSACTIWTAYGSRTRSFLTRRSRSSILRQRIIHSCESRPMVKCPPVSD
ncbi:Protein UNC-4 protein9 f, partial [Aphelenchoides avenae]